MKWGFTFLLVFNYLALAKGINQDSLYQIIDTTTSDSLKAWSFNELGWTLMFSDPQTSKEYGEKAFEVTLGQYLPLTQSTSLNLIGNFYLYSGRPDSALFYFNLALDKRLFLNDSLAIGRQYNNIGNLHRRTGKYSLAKETYQTAIDFLKNAEGHSDLAKVWNSLGYIYQNQGAFDLALNAFVKGIEIRRLLADSIAIGESQLALGGYYEITGQLDLAEEQYTLSSSLFISTGSLRNRAKSLNSLGNVLFRKGDFAASEKAYLSSLHIKKEIGISYGVAGSMTNLALIYLQRSDWAKARDLLDSAIAIQEVEMDGLGLAESYLSLGEWFEKQENYDSAAVTYQKVEAMVSTEDLRIIRLEAIKRLAQLFSHTGEAMSALREWQRYQVLNDSLVTNFQQSAQLQFELERERQQLRVREVELKEQQAIHEKNRLIAYSIFCGLVLMVITIGSFSVAFRQRQKRAEMERDKKEQEVAAILAIQSTQDKERKRIAQDLHDRLGSTLSFVKSTFKGAEAKIAQLQEENNSAYKEAIHRLDQAVVLIQEISQNLYSGVLKRFGLFPAIKELVKTVQQSTGIRFDLFGPTTEERLEEELEVVLYRITQELLNNVVKHAQANEVTVQLLYDPSEVVLTVEDDGVGFLFTETNDRGMGLLNIKSRLSPWKGKMEVDSKPGRGTFTSIVVPLV